MLRLTCRLIQPAALLVLLGGRAVPAQETTSAAPSVGIRTLPQRYARDEWHIWTSPCRSSAQRTHTLKKYGLPFAALSVALIATDRKTGKILPNTSDQAVWSGRVSQMGASYTLAGFSGAAYLLGKAIGNEHASEAGLLGLEAFGHAQVAVFAFKQMTNRQRPVDGEGKGSFWKGGTSFPSGHAAGSFAVATVFAYEYRDHLIVPIAAYTLAGLVSASRIGARRHWLSDIAVGGSLGFLIGRFTYKRNHNPNLPGSPVKRAAVTMIPEVGIGGDGGVRMSWRLTPSR